MSSNRLVVGLASTFSVLIKLKIETSLTIDITMHCYTILQKIMYIYRKKKKKTIQCPNARIIVSVIICFYTVKKRMKVSEF